MRSNFGFAMIKIVAIIALDCNGCLAILTGLKTPHGVASLGNIGRGFQLFLNGFVSFVMAFQMVFLPIRPLRLIGITTSKRLTIGGLAKG